MRFHRKFAALFAVSAIALAAAGRRNGNSRTVQAAVADGQRVPGCSGIRSRG